ncbi:MAG: hypothetical protein ACPGF7_09415 [Pontibacterium sp.]
MKLFNTFKGMLDVAAKEDIRYYLNGVHVKNEAGILTIEATNGHMLLRKKGCGLIAGDFDLILCRDSLANALELFNAKTDLVMSVADGMVMIGHKGLMLPVEVVDSCTYPNLEQVLPKEPKSTDDIGFDMKLLSKLTAAFRKAHGGKVAAGYLSLRDGKMKLDNVVGGLELVGVLMPVKMK